MLLCESLVVKTNSTIQNSSVASGGVVDDSVIRDAGTVSFKTGKTCDGVDDNDPEDPCIVGSN